MSLLVIQLCNVSKWERSERRIKSGKFGSEEFASWLKASALCEEVNTCFLPAILKASRSSVFLFWRQNIYSIHRFRRKYIYKIIGMEINIPIPHIHPCKHIHCNILFPPHTAASSYKRPASFWVKIGQLCNPWCWLFSLFVQHLYDQICTCMRGAPKTPTALTNMSMYVLFCLLNSLTVVMEK